MRPTSNAFGWENLYLFQITEEFLTLIRNLPGIPKVADLGVALGYTTLCLLKETSAFVTANDLDAGHLAELYSQVPDGEKHRLSIIAGDALGLNFQDSSLDGVLALRWMHFLRPAEIRRAFANYAKWLNVGSLLCLTAATPFFAPAAAKFLAIYKERLRCNMEWPGEMDEKTMCFSPPGVVTDHGYL